MSLKSFIVYSSWFFFKDDLVDKHTVFSTSKILVNVNTFVSYLLFSHQSRSLRLPAAAIRRSFPLAVCLASGRCEKFPEILKSHRLFREQTLKQIEPRHFHRTIHFQRLPKRPKNETPSWSYIYIYIQTDDSFSNLKLKKKNSRVIRKINGNKGQPTRTRFPETKKNPRFVTMHNTRQHNDFHATPSI